MRQRQGVGAPLPVGDLTVGPFDAAWLASMVLLSVPLLLAATGELISERGGVLNIGLEGMMLSGAFFSFLGVYLWHNVPLGVLTGMGAGVVVALIMALLCVRLRSDQIVVGVGLNLLALGVTTFTFREIFATQAEVRLDYPQPIAIPAAVRASASSAGPLFRQTLLGYLVVRRRRRGLVRAVPHQFRAVARAAGESPAAADTAGVEREPDPHPRDLRRRRDWPVPPVRTCPSAGSGSSTRG